MGLLDAFSTPDAQLGFGLLGAAAPSMAPMNLAGRLAQGNQNFQALKTQGLANDTAAQNLQMNNIALQRAQQQWEFQLPLLQQLAARAGGQQTGAAPQGAPQGAPQIGTNSTLGGQPMFSSGVTSTPAPQQPQQQTAQAPQQSVFPGVPDNIAFTQAALGGVGSVLPLIAQYNAPTDATKMANQAGTDPRTANAAALLKATNIAPISGRPGGYMVNPVTGAATQLPHVPDGYTAYQDTNGQFHIAPLDGGTQAIYGSARALEGGKGSVIPQAGYNPQTGRYGFTNRTAAAAGGAQPGTQSGVNAGPFAGYTPAGQGGPLAPQPAPGTTEAAGAQATQNVKRSGALIDAAADSPTRINVLDNIIGLSKAGVATGPTSEFVNSIKGYAASIPGFGQWKDDVTGFQEVKKFLNQNAIRAWTAAGGTGTDTQMEAAMHANPNSAMFPAAVQTMAQWAKAGEVALQAKATAQDAWLAQHQNSPQAQNQFESTWRQNFDPRVYQMSLMAPADRAAFMAKQLDATKLKAKVGTALSNGWVQ